MRKGSILLAAMIIAATFSLPAHATVASGDAAQTSLRELVIRLGEPGGEVLWAQLDAETQHSVVDGMQLAGPPTLKRISFQPDAIAKLFQTGGQTPDSGVICGTINFVFSETTLLGFDAFDYVQWKYTCHDGTAVYNVDFGDYIENVNWAFVWEGNIAHQGYYTQYPWEHYSMTEAKVGNCVFTYGCFNYLYPMIKVWSRGDGGFDWEMYNA